ncbi:hypothetical protein BH10CYA1_BH10CYA1_07040 [soil metagenome]
MIINIHCVDSLVSLRILNTPYLRSPFVHFNCVLLTSQRSARVAITEMILDDLPRIFKSEVHAVGFYV